MVLCFELNVAKLWLEISGIMSNQLEKTRRKTEIQKSPKLTPSLKISSLTNWQLSLDQMIGFLPCSSHPEYVSNAKQANSCTKVWCCVGAGSNKLHVVALIKWSLFFFGVGLLKSVIVLLLNYFLQQVLSFTEGE